jgi:hypothetical protein
MNYLAHVWAAKLYCQIHTDSFEVVLAQAQQKSGSFTFSLVWLGVF